MAYTETTSGANFSTAQAITTTANSTNVFDVTGAGAGNAPAMIGAGGVNTAMGIDIGAGDGMAPAAVLITLSAVGSSGNTLTISLQAAPDNGSYSAGTYQTIFSTQAFVESTLSANDQIIIPVPPIPPHLALPRFYRLVYTCSAAVTVTATANLLMNAPLLRDAKLYGNNFVSV